MKLQLHYLDYNANFISWSFFSLGFYNGLKRLLGNQQCSFLYLPTVTTYVIVRKANIR